MEGVIQRYFRRLSDTLWVAALVCAKGPKVRVHLAGRERQLLLRVVRCLPQLQACQPTRVLNGQASDKPQGRKPREEATRSRKVIALWGFELCLFGTGWQRSSLPRYPCPLLYRLQPNDTCIPVHVECKRAHIDSIDRTELLPVLAGSCREHVMEGWWWRQS